MSELPTTGSDRRFSDAPELVLPAVREPTADNGLESFPGPVGGNERELPTDTPTRGLASPPPRVVRPAVSLGFTDLTTPAQPIASQQTLACAQPYYFWLEIGSPVAGSVTEQSVDLPVDLLPAEVELDVLLFAPAGCFAVPADGGRIRVTANDIHVTQPVSQPAVAPALLARRLFFAVTAPKQPGEYHLSCHIHYRNLLVQSHDITVTVTHESRHAGPRAIVSRIDYTLSSKLSPSSLAGVGEHRLSISSGAASDGTHGFWFTAGNGAFHRDASFDGHEVQDLIDRARRAFRMVSWGTEDSWREGQGYRYEQPALLRQLTVDMARLAIAGYRNYDAMIRRLGADHATTAELMRRPGTIQLALKDSARLVLPLALAYDHRLDVDGSVEDYPLCQQFYRWMGDLEQHPCLLGDCPYRDVPDCRTVCPSGFWGFRHDIGVPPTLGAGDNAPSDLPASLSCAGLPNVLVAISMDPAMQERDAHIRNLRALLGAPESSVASTRAAVLERMHAGGAHLVYFYCHGGVADGTPYLQVGAPNERISSATLSSSRIRWVDPRSLVFVNGCHTTDLEPERAIDLVTSFIQTARSSGVIGTEITVFEPLAAAFAEAFVARLVERRTVGAAIRLARLRLLGSWNPLGLIYVPFAMATLQLSPVRVMPTASLPGPAVPG